MEKEVFLWLGLMILFLVVELATVGLTSIWLAGGALIALFVALAGATVAWQCIAFIVVSVLLLILRGLLQRDISTGIMKRQIVMN